MKRLIQKIWANMVKFLRWMWGECKDWRTFVLLVIVCVVIGTPVWGGYLLFILFGWEWAAAVATAVLAFWWLPGMPFFAIAVSVTLAIKKVTTVIFAKKKKKENDDREKTDPTADSTADP